MSPLTDEQQNFALDNMGLVHHFLKRYRHIPDDAREDLRGRLYYRLCLCARDFNADRGFAFSSYAMMCLEGEAKNYFRDSLWIVAPPRSLRTAILRYPSVEEAEDSDDLQGENVEALISCVRPQSLDAPAGDSLDSEHDLLHECLPSRDNVEEEVVNKIGGRQILRQVFAALTPDERFILALQMKATPEHKIAKRLAVSPPSAAKIVDELRPKVAHLYQAALNGDPLPRSQGGKTLNHIRAIRFKPAKLTRRELIESLSR